MPRSQDLALTPAVKIDRRQSRSKASTSTVGGKMGSGGYRVASPLDVFVRPERGRGSCAPHHADLPRPRIARGAQRRRAWRFSSKRGASRGSARELQRATGPAAARAGKDMRGARRAPITSASSRRSRPGLNYVGLAVPVGRITAMQLFDVARIAESTAPAMSG